MNQFIKITKMMFIPSLILFLIIGSFYGCKQQDYVAIIKTNLGNMEAKFYPDIAPKAVKNFITHSKQGYYDNVIFHRVIKDFMIQSGDPTGTGFGGQSIWGKTFKYEISDKVKHDYGKLAMAHSSIPDSNGSQFYIVQNKNGAHELDGQYTVFGYLINGFDVLDKIANQPTDSNNRPIDDIVINNIEIK